MRRIEVWGPLVLALLGPVRAEPLSADAPDAAVLATLRSGHPRLIALDDDVAQVRRRIETDPAVRQLRDALHKSAEKMLDESPVVRELSGPRLLYQSRRCLSRVYTLATMYRLDGDRRFAARAEKEMLAAAAFSDWNPPHFLDTAEMSHALAIGYDWLYDDLSPESRRAIRTALVEKGLQPSADLHRRGAWAIRCLHNWNQVCNGGMTIAALAVADEEPELAAYIVARASQAIRLPTARLAPDGGWDEGPGYWNYAMSYTAYYLAAVQTALGTDFGLRSSPGLSETGLFRIHSIGPTGLTFNYADAGASAGSAPQMLFFARLFDRPVYAWHHRRLLEEPGPAGTQRSVRAGAVSPLDLLWYDPRGTDADGDRLPQDAYFKNVDVVFLRSAWNDPAATFVGFKGGDNTANHSHLDLGTFVLDALGQRWAVDIGADDYDLPGYFGDRRWEYYRLRTQGHNTLTMNGENQDPKAKASIIAFESGSTHSRAVADLSAAYARFARRVHRGVALLDRRRVLVQDEIEVSSPCDVEWVMHTTAHVQLAEGLATLSLEDRQLRVRALESAGGAWTVIPVEPAPPQRPAENTRKLVLRFRATPPHTRVAILLCPGAVDAAEKEPPAVTSLADWPTTAPTGRRAR